MFERLLSNFFHYVSANKTLERFFRKHGKALGASRFVAGERIEEAATVVKELNDRGFSATVAYLGEFVADEEEVHKRADVYIQVVRAIEKHKLNSQISIKLTSLGLDISTELAQRNVHRILEAAGEAGVFVTIDMEDYSRYEKTLSLFEMLRKEYDWVGTVLQAYLHRTVDDLNELNRLNPHLRLVKGAYKESPRVAFREKSAVDEQFRRIIKLQMLNGHFAAVATHDGKMIEYTKELAREYRIPKDKFEFQMLYGINRQLQHELLREGYHMRIYVPFGEDWFGYFMRRLAERPANAAFVLKGIFRK